MSRSALQVRPATTDDIAALVELAQSTDAFTGAAHARTVGAGDSERLTERFGELLQERDRILLVAAAENAAIAGLLAARRDEIGAIDLTPVLHITHLIVVPGQRRRGVGRSLLAAAVHLADDAGTEHVMATVATGSREGNRYLARIGFAPLVVHRIAATSALRRSLGMTDVAGRMAVLRRARMVRAQRTGFSSRAVGRGA